MHIIHKSCLLSAFVIIGTINAVADEFHYNNILIGDRASGMGGAYTAISDDASGMFYNPAGLVYVTDRNFSASVNAYSSQIKIYDKVIANQPFIRRSSALLANYFGIVKPFGNIKLGFSYAVPDAVNEDLSQTVRNVPSGSALADYHYTLNLNNRDNTYNYGPSIAYPISNELSVGMTMYMHQRETLIIQNQFLENIDASGYKWTNSYFKMSEFGVKPVLGVNWSPVEKIALGMTVSSIFVFNSSASRQDSCYDTRTTTGCSTTTAGITIQAPSSTAFTATRKYPIRVAGGVAYFSSKDLLLSADLTYHSAVIDPVYGNKVATLDAAVGGEYYLSKKWAVRSGIFTNVANTPALVAGVTNIEEHINLYGGSLSFTRFTGDSSVTMGGTISYGVGQAQIGSSNEVQSARTFGWTLFLSSSY